MLNGEFVLTVFSCSISSAIIRIFQTPHGFYLLPFLKTLNYKRSLKDVRSILADGHISIDTFFFFFFLNDDKEEEKTEMIMYQILENTAGPFTSLSRMPLVSQAT